MALDGIFDDLTGAAVSTDLPGLKLPDLPAGCAWARLVPEQCAACPKAASDHKVWSGLSVEGPSRTWQSSLIAGQNEMAEPCRRAQTLAQLMSRAAEGMFVSDTIGVSGHLPPSEQYTWEVQSASGDTVVLKYQTGDFDPRDLVWTTLTENPNWVPGGDETEGRWLVSEHRGAMPVGAILTLNEPSRLMDRGGWIVRDVICSPSLATGGTFTLKLWGGRVGSLAMKKIPGETAPITATVTLYARLAEPWVHPLEATPLFVGPDKTDFTLESPVAGVNTVYAGRARAYAAGRDYVAVVDGSSERRADMEARVRVEHTAGGYRTVLDLSGYSAAMIAAPLTVSLLLESASDDAQCLEYAAQDRCAHSAPDRTSTWGMADAVRGCTSYCAKGHALRQTAAGRQFLRDYKPACYQTACPYWQEPEWPNPNAAWDQLMWGVPWLHTITKPEGAPPVLSAARKEVPGLAYQAGWPVGLPEGDPVAEEKFYNWFGGRWPKMQTITSETGHPALMANPGFNTLLRNAAGDYASLDDPGDWPGPGPGKAAWTRQAQYGTAALSSANAPHGLDRNHPLGGDGCFDLNTGERRGGAYRRQRFMPGYEWWLPALDDSLTLQLRDDGFFLRGAWDENFAPVESSPVYVARAKLLFGKRYSRQAAPPYPLAVVTSVTLGSVSGSVLDLAHKAMSATGGYVSGGDYIMRPATWLSGGTNVQLPETHRWRQWDCAQSVNGLDPSCVSAGCVLAFTDPRFAGSRLYNQSFWVTKAEACAGARQHFRPDAPVGWTEAEDLDWYEANVMYLKGGPYGHQDWVARRDRLTIVDPHGLIAAWSGDLIGANLTVLNGGIMLDDNVTVVVTGPAVSDTVLTAGTDYDLFGAAGEIWLKTAVPAGACLKVTGTACDHSGEVLAAELNAVPTVFNRILMAGEASY
jgi:hypothetical protein